MSAPRMAAATTRWREERSRTATTVRPKPGWEGWTFGMRTASSVAAPPRSTATVVSSGSSSPCVRRVRSDTGSARSSGAPPRATMRSPSWRTPSAGEPRSTVCTRTSPPGVGGSPSARAPTAIPMPSRRDAPDSPGCSMAAGATTASTTTTVAAMRAATPPWTRAQGRTSAMASPSVAARSRPAATGDDVRTPSANTSTRSSSISSQIRPARRHRDEEGLVGARAPARCRGHPCAGPGSVATRAALARAMTMTPATYSLHVDDSGSGVPVGEQRSHSSGLSSEAMAASGFDARRAGVSRRRAGPGRPRWRAGSPEWPEEPTRRSRSSSTWST